LHSFDDRVNLSQPARAMVPQARKPLSGSTIVRPRRRNASTLARTASCSHMLLFMAERGPQVHETRDREWKENRPPDRAQISKHVRRSGRDKQQIVFLRDADVLDRTGVRRFGACEEKRSVMTLRPVNEAKVRGRMNSSADRSGPPALRDRSGRARGRFRGFICRDPAAHAQNDAHASNLIDTRNIFHHDRVGLDIVLDEPTTGFFHRDYGRLFG